MILWPCHLNDYGIERLGCVAMRTNMGNVGLMKGINDDCDDRIGDAYGFYGDLFWGGNRCNYLRSTIAGTHYQGD